MVHDVVSGRDDRARPGSRPRRLRILHVVVQAGPTNSQWNEHCLPVADERELVVCSLFPATVPADPRIELLEGDGSARGAMRVLRAALRDRQYDAVHVHAPASAALLIAACALERRSRRNIVMTLHNSWPNFRRRNKWLAALAVAAFPHVVACSQGAAESIPRRVRRLARNGVHVVPNGVDVDRVDRALTTARGDAEQPSRRRGVTFVTVGRLIPIKDQATLLRAFARVGGSIDRLVVIGEGPLRVKLEHLADELGIADRVELIGLVPRDEVYGLLSRSDVFVSPSRGEGLPLSVLEAMTARLPVVLSDIPPHRELVEDITGITLVQPGDVDGLAEAMRLLRDNAPSVREALGARCRRMVIDRFSIRSMSEGYRRIYTEVGTTRRHPDRHRPRNDKPEPRETTPRTSPTATTPDEGGPVRQNMDLGDVAGGIRRRWWLVLLLAVLGASAGYYTAANVPVIYRAEATILVGPTDGAVTHSSTIRASEDLAAFYADMARRQLVLDPVVRRLGLDGTWADLRDEVSAQVPAQNLRLVTVTVLGDEQGTTEDIADAIVEQLVALSPAAPDGNEQAFVNQQVDDLKNTIEQAEQRINELESRIDQTTDESARDTMHDQIAALQAQVSDWQSTYVDLVGVEPSSDAGGLQVLDEAVPVTDKDRSGQVKQAAVGGLAGGVLGMLLAWLLHRRHARRVQRWNAEREAAIESAAALESAAAPVAEDRLVSNGHAVPGTALGAPAVNGQPVGQVGNGQVANGHNGARQNAPGPNGAARNGTARSDSGNVRPMSGKSKGGRR